MLSRSPWSSVAPPRVLQWRSISISKPIGKNKKLHCCTALSPLHSQENSCTIRKQMHHLRRDFVRDLVGLSRALLPKQLRAVEKHNAFAFACAFASRGVACVSQALALLQASERALQTGLRRDFIRKLVCLACSAQRRKQALLLAETVLRKVFTHSLGMCFGGKLPCLASPHLLQHSLDRLTCLGLLHDSAR